MTTRIRTRHARATEPALVAEHRRRRHLVGAVMGARRAAVALVVALALVACGDGNGEEVGDERDAYGTAVAGLCEAADDAGSGSAASARQVFYDEAHQALHELAAETAETDRATAAALLEAKQSVEAGLDESAGDLADRIRSLLAATNRALAVTEHDPVRCPGTS